MAKHDFGILDRFEENKWYQEYEPEKYNCVSVDMDDGQSLRCLSGRNRGNQSLCLCFYAADKRALRMERESNTTAIS